MIPTPTLDQAAAASWRPDLTGENSEDLLAFYHAALPTLRPDAAIVEVGVAWGRSLVYAAELRAALGHTGRVYGVDAWRGPDAQPAAAASRMTYHAALTSITSHSSPLELERVHLMREDSLDAALRFAFGSLDLVMIDADHSLPAVALDIQAWRQRVRPGFWLCGHDYSPNFPDVVRAVDLYLGPGVRVYGTCWFYRT